MNKYRTLYNGNNERWVDQLFRPHNLLPEYWTTGPLNALGHAYNSARKFNSRMTVVVLENIEIPSVNFREFEGIKVASQDATRFVKWYKLIKRIFSTKEEQDQKLKIYTQEELKEFLKKHSPNDHQGGDSESHLDFLIKKLGDN